MLGCQQSVQGNSGIIIGGSILWLAIAADYFGPFGKYARKTANGQQLFLALVTHVAVVQEAIAVGLKIELARSGANCEDATEEAR